MSVKIVFLLSAGWIFIGCSPTSMFVDSSSVNSITELNNEIKVSKTSVHLLNGIDLFTGDFELDIDTLIHSHKGEVVKYPLSNVRSIKTVKNHSSTTIVGLSLIAGGLIVFDSIQKEDEFLEMPNQIRDELENESGSGFLTDRFKGNLFGSALSISGLIILVTGVRNATKTYYFN